MPGCTRLSSQGTPTAPSQAETDAFPCAAVLLLVPLPVAPPLPCACCLPLPVSAPLAMGAAAAAAAAAHGARARARARGVLERQHAHVWCESSTTPVRGRVDASGVFGRV